MNAEIAPLFWVWRTEQLEIACILINDSIEYEKIKFLHAFIV